MPSLSRRPEAGPSQMPARCCLQIRTPPDPAWGAEPVGGISHALKELAVTEAGPVGAQDMVQAGIT